MKIPMVPPTCALCYLVFSCFAVITLVCMGLLEYPGRYEKMNGDENLPPEEYSKYSDSLFWGAIFYAVCFVLCSFRYACHYIEEKDKARQVLSV